MKKGKTGIYISIPGLGKAETTVVVVAVAGVAVATLGDPAGPGNVVPTPAASDTVGGAVKVNGVRLRAFAVIIAVKVIMAQFIDVSAHVIESQFVGCLLSHFVGFST